MTDNNTDFINRIVLLCEAHDMGTMTDVFGTIWLLSYHQNRHEPDITMERIEAVETVSDETKEIAVALFT